MSMACFVGASSDGHGCRGWWCPRHSHCQEDRDHRPTPARRCLPLTGTVVYISIFLYIHIFCLHIIYLLSIYLGWSGCCADLLLYLHRPLPHLRHRPRRHHDQVCTFPRNIHWRSHIYRYLLIISIRGQLIVSRMWLIDVTDKNKVSILLSILSSRQN